MPHHNFGPWTTSLTAGSRMELSAFWRDRLIRLAIVNNGRVGITIFGVLALIAFAAGIGSLPLLHSESEAAGETPTEAGPSLLFSATNKAQLASPAERDVLKRLQDRTAANFVDTPLYDALESIAEFNHVRLRIDTAAVDEAVQDHEPRVTLMWLGTPLKPVLKALLEPWGLDWFIDGDELVVTTRERAASHFNNWIFDVYDLAQVDVPPAELAAAITSLVNYESWQQIGGRGTLRIDKDELHVRQTRDAVSEIDELLMDIRHALQGPRREVEAADRRTVTRIYPIGGFRSTNLAPELRLSDQELTALLRKHVLPTTWRPNGGDALLYVEGDKLFVRQTLRGHECLGEFLGALPYFTGSSVQPSDDLFTAIGYMLDLNETHRTVREAAARPQTLAFDDVQFDEFVLQLTKATHIPIWIDAQEFLNMGQSREFPVSLHVEKKPLSRVLDFLLAPHMLGWFVVEPGVIVVTSKRRAEARHETRVFRTHELQRHHRVPTLIDRITSEIEQETWSAAGGSGLIRPLSGVLIVRNNRRVLDLVEELLNGLEGPGPAAAK